MAPAAPLALLSAPPVFTSAEEHAAHQAATPASFDLPPVLRKRVKAHVQLTPALDAGFAELAQEGGVEGELFVTDGCARRRRIANCV